MGVWRMAWRNVWRNQRRALVTIGATALGLWAMVVYSGMLEGFLQSLEHSVVEIEVGDIQVFAAGYRDNPSIHERIAEPDALIEHLEALGFEASGRLLSFGLAAGDDASAGASFRGINPEQDADVSLVHAQVHRGAWLDTSAPREIVLGRGLAKSLGTDLGDEVLVFSEAADGSLAYDLYTVRGVLRAIGGATDRSGIFMVEAAFRDLFEVREGVHQMLVRRPPGVDLEVAAAQVSAAAPSLEVKSWRTLMPTVSSMLEQGRSIVLVIFFVAYIAIALLILNAMLMAVFERVREFGVLKALGVGPGGVLALILAESAIQTSVAIAIGLAVAAPTLVYLSRVGIDVASMAGTSMMGIAMQRFWKAAVQPATIVEPVLVLVAIVWVAVLYPAVKAAVIQPVDAIRHH